MAKERLSKLQKWILTRCYEDGKHDHKVAYYIKRQQLVAKRISEYYEEHGKPKFITERVEIWGEMTDLHDSKKEKLADNRIKAKLEVALINSMRNLVKKGYLGGFLYEFPNSCPWDVWQKEKWKWYGIWLTDKGIELVKSLLLVN